MKTVYVIGAGASYEANLPTGDMLKGEIATLLNMKFNHHEQTSGDYEIQQSLRLHTEEDRTFNSLNEYLRECRHISENMPLAISIDNFIDSQRENDKLALCGKLAITKSILKAEKGSKLFFDRNNGQRTLNFSSLEKTWYLLFFRTITENCSVEDLLLRFQNITLIIFNYDRCVEHFLLQALTSYYRLSQDAAASIISNLTIIHPYGTVGALSWLNPKRSVAIEFGGELHVSQLVAYANGIRTFTEGAHSESMEILEANMKNAERLVFLGFAFHRLNMNLLRGSSNGYDSENAIKCIATAFEMSKSDRDSIAESIQYLYNCPVYVHIENSTCNKIFKDYSRSLGFS
ncbi:hypothetical protein GCM10011613_28180 [Cellvibrio zantedeschiae]|uniref:SIR2-like domain-containing protein n=1 Tax=Cellvibrio zantedeschiae TaxID=1237077 RepID=A0ABQ3B830_9GAMM|nr:hypothetical protein [Cellvibrio zantedeschiae]GGY81846.1 hypothetical protein GCM10011613_28180 [Cellvibrio zantedeschiae]